MVNVVGRFTSRTVAACERSTPLRSIRPSLLDVRFTGDPWVVEHEDGTATLQLDNYRLARIRTLPFDLPSLNQLLLQLRQWQMRRRLDRQRQTRLHSA